MQLCEDRVLPTFFFSDLRNNKSNEQSVISSYNIHSLQTSWKLFYKFYNIVSKIFFSLCRWRKKKNCKYNLTCTTVRCFRLMFGSRLSNSYFCIMLHLSFVSRVYLWLILHYNLPEFVHLRLVRNTTECICEGISLKGWQSGEDLSGLTARSHRSLPPKGKSRKHI